MKVADLFAKLGLKTDKGSFEQGNKLIGSVKKALGLLAAYEGVKWLHGLVQGTANAADHVAKLARSTGITSDTLQEFGYISGLAGGNMDETATSLQRLAKAAEAANEGSKLQAEAFQKMGVATKDAHGNLRPVEDVLGDMADYFATIPDGTQKTAIAMDLMGQSGAQMIPFLNQGSAGLAKLKQEAHDLGVVLDKDTLHQVEDFNDQQTRFAAVWKGLKFTLLKALLPTLKDVVDRMVAWMKANKGVLEQKIHVFAQVLATALLGVAKAVGYVLDAFEFLDAHWDVAKYAVYGLAIALGLYEAAALAAGIASVAAGAESAAAWLLGLWPLALLALAIEDVYQAFNGGDSVFGAFAQMIKDKFGVDIIGAIRDVVHAIPKIFDAVEETVKKSVAALENLISKIMDVAEKLGITLGVASGRNVVQQEDASYNGIRAANARRVQRETEKYGVVGARRLAAQRALSEAGSTSPSDALSAPDYTAAYAAKLKDRPLLDVATQGLVRQMLTGQNRGSLAAHRAGNATNIDARTTVDVTVNGGDPQQVKGAVTDAVKDAHADMFRTAQANLGGG